MGNTLSCCQPQNDALSREEHQQDHHAHDRSLPADADSEKAQSEQLSPGYEQLELKFPATATAVVPVSSRSTDGGDEGVSERRAEEKENSVEEEEQPVASMGRRRIGGGGRDHDALRMGGRREEAAAAQAEETSAPEAPRDDPVETVKEDDATETTIVPLTPELPVESNPTDEESIAQEALVKNEKAMETPVEINSLEKEPAEEAENDEKEEPASFSLLPELQLSDNSSMENVLQELQLETPAPVLAEEAIPEPTIVQEVQSAPASASPVEETGASRPASSVIEARVPSPSPEIITSQTSQDEQQMPPPPVPSASHLQPTEDAPASIRYSISASDLRSSVVFNNKRGSNRMSTQSILSLPKSRPSSPLPQEHNPAASEPEHVEPAAAEKPNLVQSSLSQISASLKTLETESLDPFEVHLQTLSMLNHYSLWEQTMRLRRELKAFISAGAADFYVYDPTGNIMDIDMKSFNRAVRGFEQSRQKLMVKLDELAEQEEQEEMANEVADNTPKKSSPRRMTVRGENAARGFWQRRDTMMNGENAPPPAPPVVRAVS